MAGVLLSEQAAKDLAGLGADRARVEDLLRALGQVPRPQNLDLKKLRGRAPWSRARTGPFRVIFRPLSAEGTSGRGYLVAQIVHRRELERIIRRL